MHTDVIPHVVAALREHCVRPDRLEKTAKMTNGLGEDDEDTTASSTPADTLSAY